MLFRERKQIVICLAAAAMVGGFVLFRYLPLRGKMRAVESRLFETQAAVDKAQAQSEQLPALREKLLILQRAVGNYQRQVPCHRELGGFLQGIAELMNRQNLTGQVIQPGREVNLEQLICIPISMKCEGRLAQIFEFFKSLQALDRVVRIEQVKLINDSDFNGRVSMQTEAVIYYRAEPAQG
jgi:Tfp pilus assembly protein PilO